MLAARNPFSTKIYALLSAACVWSFAAISTAQDSNFNDNDIYESVSDEKLETAFRSLKRNDSLQFDLPDAIAQQTPGWLKKLGEAIAAFFKAIGPLLEIIFWVGLGVIIMGVIYIVAQTIYSAYRAGLSKEKSVKVDTPVPLYQPAEQKARILLEQVDALAAEGRYDEAVHTLLQRSIQDIDANRPNVIRRSLTSREISTLSVLTETAQGAFSSIAQIVEHSYFGGHTIGRSEFESAREAYSALAMSDVANKAMAA